MTAEKFLQPDPKPPIDEEEIREAVWELLFSRAPPALVRVVGKQVYHRWAVILMATSLSVSEHRQVVARCALRSVWARMQRCCYGQVEPDSLREYKSKD